MYNKEEKDFESFARSQGVSLDPNDRFYNKIKVDKIKQQFQEHKKTELQSLRKAVLKQQVEGGQRSGDAITKTREQEVEEDRQGAAHVKQTTEKIAKQQQREQAMEKQAQPEQTSNAG